MARLECRFMNLNNLQLWRCWVLYAGFSRPIRWITGILCIVLYLLLIGKRQTLLSLTLHPSESESASGVLLGMASQITRGLAILHPVSVLTTNFVFASFIVGSLLYHQRCLKTLTSSDHSSQYTSIAAMIIESASTNIVFQTLALASTAAQNWGTMERIFNVNLLGQTQVRTMSL